MSQKPELMSETKRGRAAWIDSLRSLTEHRDAMRLMAMMGLFFLVVCAVGILRPIKNALALDGLGATDFARVYLVSAVVVLFAPVFNRLSDWLPRRTLFAAIAFFFAGNLVLFRIFYEAGSGTFGLLFYGWYDLFAAALVAQFFMATQVYFDARSAKTAYPVVIAGGSIGATLGGGITGFFAESLGTPNLLLVAAAFIAVFAVGIPWVLSGGDSNRLPERRRDDGFSHLRQGGRGTLAELFADRQVRLIAGTVLLTIVVKQLVDYQFNVITKEVFDSRDAISAFQGKFNAATQWLPLVVLAGLRPAMRRWGIGTAVLLLPVAMFGTTLALAVTFGLWAAVAAKGAETSLRYSAERAGREMLYVPVRDEIKLKAKAYIDVGIEKGLGKVISGLVIMGLLTVMDYRRIAWVSAALAVVWLFTALLVRREYVRTLAQSIEGRFASLRGVFASLLDASTLPVVKQALAHESPLRSAFALEMLAQLPAGEAEAVAPELMALVDHERAEIRAAALRELARIPAAMDAVPVRARLLDASPAVREAAVRALVAAAGDDAPALLDELLRHDAARVRSATLAVIVGSRGTPAYREAGRDYVAAHRFAAPPADAVLREELALAAGALSGGDDDAGFVDAFLDDAEPRVRAAALRSAALLGRADCCARMIAALEAPATRQAARDALAGLGAHAVPPLEATLLDESASPHLRRVIPATLARIPSQQTVTAMLRLVLAPETDQLLDYRTLKALSKLRAANPDLLFDSGTVHQVARREAEQGALYAAVSASLHGNGNVPPRVAPLLRAALDEAYRERREGVFRCIGLLYAPDEVLQAYQAVVRAAPGERARALEWIEETIGTARFRDLAPVLEPRHAIRPQPVATLQEDGDSWIACLARAATTGSEDDMELIEKVFLLQQIDLLHEARGAHVALLASIAAEVDVPADTVLISEGDAPAAMYIVIRGSVELQGVGHRLVVGAEHAFGTWALIDSQPSPITARTCEPTRLLRVTREDFHDLLADHAEVALGLLQGLAHRMRSLVA
jgi:ATP:ADP antiporter, AAA family